MYWPVIDPVETGKNIKRLRKENGYSVADLQNIFGFNTPQAIYKWQYGVALPALENLVVLAQLFEVSMDDIIVLEKREAKKEA